MHTLVLAMREECLNNNVILSELIIDGKIAVDGDVQPTDVVQKILDISASRESLVQQIP